VVRRRSQCCSCHRRCRTEQGRRDRVRRTLRPRARTDLDGDGTLCGRAGLPAQIEIRAPRGHGRKRDGTPRVNAPAGSDLLVAGSVALDTRDGPFGKVEETLGGSAVYFALAASLILPVKVVAPVGLDGAKRVAQAFSGRPIDTELLEILEAPTYRWRAHQEHGRNVDLGSSDNIYDTWSPSVPEGFEGWAFVGSMRPDRQAQVMAALLGSAKLLAADAMLSYVLARPPEARDVLR